MNPARIVAKYFIFQAVGTAAWWLLLIFYPPSIKWFQPRAWSPTSLLSFWLADFILIVLGSIITAIGVLRQREWASNAVSVVAMAVSYPTLVCIAASIQTGEAWIASAMMACMAGLSLAMVTIQGRTDQSPATIRVTSMNRRTAILWTLAQTTLFWCIFLWVLPMGITELEHYCGIPGFVHLGQSTGSLALFIAASCVGLWSGITMAACGDGTPLPTATAPRLVIVGPYRFVRNPMAIAGVTQGLAVGWYLGSYTVIIYSLYGGLLWHLFVRPFEESDLTSRFGDTYVTYQRRVYLWIPTLR